MIDLEPPITDAERSKVAADHGCVSSIESCFTDRELCEAVSRLRHDAAVRLNDWKRRVADVYREQLFSPHLAHLKMVFDTEDLTSIDAEAAAAVLSIRRLEIANSKFVDPRPRQHDPSTSIQFPAMSRRQADAFRKLLEQSDAAIAERAALGKVSLDEIAAAQSAQDQCQP